MNKKTLVIGICVVLLGVSGFLVYRTFFSSPAPAPAALSGIPVAGQTGSKVILPYGQTLDFSSIETYNAERKKFPYPQVSSGDIGVQPQQLIK